MTTSSPPAVAVSAAASLPDYRLGLHLCAMALVLGILLLIGIGGNVTSLDAGMAVPDWPGTFGYNMFLAPLNEWFYESGTFWEHSHRLKGAAVGVLAIALVFWLWLTQPHRDWLRWLGITLLGLIIVQGLMGGFRVTENSQFLAAVHGVFGQIILTLAVLIAAATSQWWHQLAPPPAGAQRPPRALAERLILTALVLGALAGSMLLRGGDPQEHLIVWGWSDVGLLWAGAMAAFLLIALTRLLLALEAARRLQAAPPGPGGRQIRWFSRLLLTALLLQLVLGAAVRHSGAEYAIPDAPLSYGRLVPPMNQETLDQAITLLPEALQENVPPGTTASQVHLHFTHRAWAVVVLLLGLAVTAVTARYAGHPAIRLPLGAAMVALVAQIMLGIMTVWSGIYFTFATAHQALGAALLGLTTWLVIRIHLVTRAPAATPSLSRSEPAASGSA